MRLPISKRGRWEAPPQRSGFFPDDTLAVRPVSYKKWVQVATIAARHPVRDCPM